VNKPQYPDSFVEKAHELLFDKSAELNETLLWKLWIRSDEGRLSAINCCGAKWNTIWSIPPIEVCDIPREPEHILFVGMSAECDILRTESMLAKAIDTTELDELDLPPDAKEGDFLVTTQIMPEDGIVVPSASRFSNSRYLGGIFDKYGLGSAYLRPGVGITFFWDHFFNASMFLDLPKEVMSLPRCILTTGYTERCTRHMGQLCSVHKRIKEIGKTFDVPVHKIPSFNSLVE